MNQNSIQLSLRLAKLLTRANLKICTAESCTGGLLSATLTEISGSSQWFERGLVTYSNLSKQQMLAVPENLLQQHGAVSKQVAEKMADGALQACTADISVAITGVAGPTGGTKSTPVGCVWLSFAAKNKTTESFCLNLKGSRHDIREQTVCWALTALLLWLNKKPISVDDVMKKLQGARVFFALKPDGRIKAACNQVLKNIPRGIRTTHVDDFHVTLSFVGNIDGLMLDEINKFKLEEKLPRIPLIFDKIEYWSKARAIVLTSSQTPKPLIEFVRTLNNKLTTLGLAPDLKTIKPHITLARKVNRSVYLKEIEPIEWNIREYCLMISMPRGIPKYKIIQRW